MINEWINENYDNIKKWLKNIIKDENPSVQQDLIHDIIITFMEHPKAEQLIEDDEARWFIVRIALNQSRSVTSSHYKTYKQNPINEFDDTLYEVEEEDYDLIRDNQIETLLNCLDEMYNGNNKERYYVMLILLYSTIENFSEISRRINIPRTTVSKNYKDGLEILKEKYMNTTNRKLEINNKTIKILKTTILKDYGRD
jgi:DNA-directed RNA polymerase specialized sigma24 family protein